MAKVMKTNLEQMQERMGSLRGSSDFWKAKPGKNYVRFLPGIEGKADPGSFISARRTHTIESDRGFFAKVACVNPDAWCPYCAMSEIFEGQDDGDKVAKALQSRTAFLANVIVKDDPEEQIRIWDIPYTVIESLKELLEDEQWGDFTDPETGFFVAIRRKGSKRGTKYSSVTPTRQGGPLPPWVNLDAAHNLLSPKLIRREKSELVMAAMIDKYGDYIDDLETQLADHRTSFIARQKKAKVAAPAENGEVPTRRRRKRRRRPAATEE